MQHGLAEGRCIHGDQIEARGGHGDQHHACDHDVPVLYERAKDFGHRRSMLTLFELLRFFEITSQNEDERHDHAADKKRHAPSPRGDGRRVEPLIEREAERRGNDDGDLLARGLPAREEAFLAGSGHFREIHRHATEFRARRETLQQTAEQHEGRSEEADGRVARHERDQDGAARHDRERHDETLAAADIVDIGAQNDRAERPHQEARAEDGEGHHERSKFTGRREKHSGDLCRVEAEQEEVELLQEVASRDAQHGGALRVSGGRGMSGGVHRMSPDGDAWHPGVSLCT
ncbi:hypothetical protein AWB74_08836 [Caballeronia arvi]|uniref:Uncharacterized protein n=1 Tax=Caballeronia arvi TaxID=1777135 RepID=A0A158L794_9BURK|nr:hypothetical protein AWB74_08836 [Caballeronia arvi]